MVIDGAWLGISVLMIFVVLLIWGGFWAAGVGRDIASYQIMKRNNQTNLLRRIEELEKRK